MRERKLMFSVVLLLVVSLVVALAGCGQQPAPATPTTPTEPAPAPAGPKFITVASGSPGGAYFPLGAGIAKVLTDKIEGVFAQSESTGASVENSRLVGRGESDMGMAMANVAYDAFVGQGAFDGDKQDIVALFSMYPAAQHLFVSADSNIFTIEDLVGKKISVDAAGSGCEVTSYIILEAAGIRDKVTTVNLSQPEAADAIKDGNVDAVFYNFAYPGAVVEEILITKNIRFIPLETALLDKIIADYPYFTKGVIPKGVYKLENDVSALTVGNLMVVHKDMDEELAYNSVKAIFDEGSLKELIGIHPIAKVMSKEVGANSPIPLHPGAERFFQGR
jgi:uncharacterized protein